jgi:predicted dehydrogenase
MNKAVSILLVGIGGYGNLYSGALLDNINDDRYYIAGVVDPKPENSRNYERLQNQGIPFYNTIEAFYREKAADLAIIASPIHFHSVQSCYALSQGSNVLCEKPICATPSDAMKMIKARDASGRFLAVGYQWSYCKAMLQAKKDIISGRYGRPVRLKTLVLWPRDGQYYSRGWAGRVTDDKGNLILDSVANNATAHYLHNMFFILGGSPEASVSPAAVTAELYRANNIENFDTVAARIMTTEGTELLFMAAHPTFTTKGPCFEYEFEKGKIMYDAGENASESELKGILEDGTIVDYGSPNDNEFVKLWTAIAAVNGEADITCTAETALPQICCIDAMQKSVPDILQFPTELVKKSGNPVLTYVEGLDKAFIKCYDSWKLPSEGGVLWAAAGKTIMIG